MINSQYRQKFRACGGLRGNLITPSRTRPPVGPRQVVPTHCHRHTLCAWAPPSPRVRLHEAHLTYLLTPGSVSPLQSATQTRSHVRRHSFRSPYRDAIGWYSTTNQSCASGWPARPAGWPGPRHMHMPPRLPPSSPRPSYPASPALHFSRTYLTHLGP